MRAVIYDYNIIQMRVLYYIQLRIMHNILDDLIITTTIYTIYIHLL